MKKIYLILCVCLVCNVVIKGQSDGFGMRMHVINVGQAEAILLEFQKHAVLVDAGAEIVTKNDKTKDYVYANNLKKYLKDFFARRVDLNNTFYGVINSHPHPDHANQFRRVIFTEKYNVQNFIESGDNLDDFGYIDKEYLAKKGTTHYNLDEITMGEVNILAKWESELLEKSGVEIKFLNGYRKCNDENNFSLVMKVSYKGKSFLLTGDSEVDDYDKYDGKDYELCLGLVPYLLGKYKSNLSFFKADVYKVGHHGSHNGTREDLLSVINPTYSVISAGNHQVDNYSGFGASNHGHPNEKAMKVLLKKTIGDRPSTKAIWFKRVNKNLVEVEKLISKAVYCTCWDDTIVFTVNKVGTEVSVETKSSN